MGVPTDSASLVALEEDSWSEATRTPLDQIMQGLDHHPCGTFVLESTEGQVIGAIYTQFINSIDDIDAAASVEYCASIRSSTGNVLQLIRVNTLSRSREPAGGSGIPAGVMLRDFALLYAAEMGSSVVCAVTRCTGFQRDFVTMGFEQYALSRTITGPGSDSGLSFHLKRGATVIKCISSWRAGDVSNMGFGVLVQYDVQGVLDSLKTKSGQVTLDPTLVTVLTISDIETAIQLKIESILEKPVSFADKSMPIMALGLDSLQSTQLVEDIGSVFVDKCSQRYVNLTETAWGSPDVFCNFVPRNRCEFRIGADPDNYL